jgi:predicted DsbA family dithiol-disulfide isomerase
MEEGMRLMSAENKSVAFKVDWLPFFLSTEIPESGVSLAKYIQSKYGGPLPVPGAISPMKQRLIEAGEQVAGKPIHFFKQDQMVTPSLNSHRLIELSKRQNKVDECMEAVFEMYFENGIPLNSMPDLIKAAEKAGVVGAAEYLKTTEDADDVKYQASKWKGSVTGVPHFFIYNASAPQERLQFSGAQPPQMFVRAFSQALKLTVGRGR